VFNSRLDSGSKGAYVKRPKWRL